MTRQRWAKFFWDDWENDPALRLCSLSSQGLWMRMLCIAAHHDPVGYVCIQGKPISNEALARIVGQRVEEIEEGLADLEAHGVFSRDRLKRIFCRRMVFESKKSLVAQQNGKLGGNPTLLKQKKNPSSDNPSARAIARSRASASASASDSSSSKVEKGGAGEKEVNGFHLTPPEPKSRGKAKRELPVRETLERVLSPEIASAVIEHRVSTGKPLTGYAAKLLAADLVRAKEVCGLSPNEAAEHMIRKGWRGFDPAWVVEDRERRFRPRSTGPPSGFSDDPMAGWDEKVAQLKLEDERNGRH